MSCSICGEEKNNYLRSFHEASLWQCAGCGLVFSDPHLPQRGLPDIHENSPLNIGLDGRTETEASKRYLDILIRRSGAKSKILLVAPHDHCFSVLARKRELHVVAHLDVQEFERGITLDQPLDAVVFIYQLEKCLSPQQVLDNAYALMRPGGALLVITPSLDSRSARFFGSSWTEWRPENRYYFDNITIQSLLWRYGFHEVQLDKDLRWYTLAHINNRAAHFPRTWITRAINLFYHILPSSFRNVYFRLPTSGVVVSARKAERRERPTLSVVVPVYNESATFPTLIEKLIAKQMNEVEKEVIIVESNSTDNSRQLVMQYENRPGIKIVLQEKARGKGNAVREGFDHANGDILLIQDADLEYDMNDYEALVEPIGSFRHPFMLGARHGGKWKMRHFNDQEHLSTYFNFGHSLFTTLINLLYGQRLKDPFTMFKVFRRDCLYNLKLECNRFDFDFELVIKLIRKGYTPIEIPVNYYSRSFKEGKKVDMFRDPLTWLNAAFKYRFAKITKD